ncbi:MAG: outer membrane protein assembly factor BamD [Phycisphaerales bacterium JB063]
MQQPTRRGPWARLGRASLLLAALACACGPAQAQQRHELTEQGEWSAVDEPAPDSPEGELLALQRRLASGETRGVVEGVSDWLERNPTHPQEPAAYLLRGDARVMKGYYYLAIADYEAIVGLFPGTEYYQTALQREYDIALIYIGGVKRRGKLTDWRLYPAGDIGVELLIRIQERLPGSALGEKASIGIGDYYFQEGTMDMAVEAYSIFLEATYPDSPLREWAMLRLIQASLAQFKGPEFDPTGLFEAGQRLQQYRDEFPAAAERIGADALLVRIRESLALKELVTAQWYDRRDERLSAVTMYRRVIADYPDTAAAGRAFDRLDALGEPLVDPRAPGAADPVADEPPVLDAQINPPTDE